MQHLLIICIALIKLVHCKDCMTADQCDAFKEKYNIFKPLLEPVSCSFIDEGVSYCIVSCSSNCSSFKSFGKPYVTDAYYTNLMNQPPSLPPSLNPPASSLQEACASTSIIVKTQILEAIENISPLKK